MEEKARGNECLRIGDYARALEHYNKALELCNTREVRCQVLNNKALALLKLGLCERSIKACEEVLLEQPCNYKALWRKGLALEEMFRFKEALEVMNLAVVLSPPNCRRQILQKIGILKHNFQCFKPPELTASERRGFLDENQTLRLSFKDTEFPCSISPTSVTYIDISIYISNEFGLFDKSIIGNQMEPIFLRCRVELMSDETNSGLVEFRFLGSSHPHMIEMTTMGRFQGQIEIESPEENGVLFMLRFECVKFEFPVIPLLTPPILVSSSNYSRVSSDRSIFSCIREIKVDNYIKPLYVLESVGSLGIAGRIWDSAVILISLLKRKKNILGQKVIELGAGTGVVGIACASLIKGTIIITDLPLTLDLIKRNIKLNESKLIAKVNVSEFKWGETAVVESYDSVIMSDVVYNCEAYSPLITSLKNFARKNAQCKIIWAHRHRNPDDWKFFEELECYFVSEVIHGPGPRFFQPKGHETGLNSGEEMEMLPTIQHSSSDVTVYLTTPRSSSIRDTEGPFFLW